MNTEGKLMLVAGAVTAYVMYRGYSGAKTFVTETINPASDKNFVYQASGGADNPEVMKSNDLFFANATLLNPFASAESKEQARNLKKVFYGK